jgi:hypothetical protein
MLNKTLNAKLLWMQFEDVLAPRLGLTVKERAVYSYLLRHSLVVGKLRLQFAVMALARTLGLSIGAARHAVRRLDELGALRVLKRSKTGHLAEMRLPEKIRALRAGRNGASMVVGMGAVGVGHHGGRRRAACLDDRNHGFLENLGAPQGHSRSRTRRLLLLSPPHSRSRTRPRPRCAPRALRPQFLPQPGFLLSRMQLAQGRSSGPGFSAYALPPGAPDARRTRRTPSRLERSRRRQAPPLPVDRK